MSEREQSADHVIPPPPQPGDVYEVPAAGSLGLLALGGLWLQAVLAGSFAVVGGVLAWLRQRVGRWSERAD
jgi:hypothetical protein